MKKLKLGTQLNISFALVLFVPMIIATVFSIGYYSQKIREEAVNTISSDLKVANIIYQNTVLEMQNLASAYAQKKIINFLIGYNLGEKIGTDWAQSAKLDNIDMITIVDTDLKVLVRSHAPEKLNDILTEKHYVNSALYGLRISGTEVLTIDELKQEGFKMPHKWQKVLAITGSAPVYDRHREKIVGAIIVRRILNSSSLQIVKDISEKLGVNAALFEHTRLITSNLSKNETQEKNLIPSLEILNTVLKENKAFHTASITTGGSIAKYMPVKDFNEKSVGILMIQTGVENYIRTRNIAIITLLGIFLTGFILALIVKTIIEKRIVTPVKDLKKGAEKIGRGDYEYEIAVKSGDEIGELTEAFNKMARELKEYDIQLKQYNQQLEERVKERTSELQIANEQLVQANTVLEDTLEILNPGVSRLIEKNKQQLGLIYGTELVADVCTYTKLNMLLGENMIGEFMKKFFRESHKLLAEYRGMFDKTVGDQIVAIFGTPKDHSPASPLHPFDAIACALKMVEAAEKINKLMQEAIQDNYTAIAARYQSLSKEDRDGVKIEDLKFRCRIGINTSNPSSDREIDRMRMVMMGAETCVDYTAQGGAVIYAFRLESTGTPGQIYIGENTRRLVDHVYLLKEMPSITLKGLGTQTRYMVISYQPVFDNIYPKSRFYKTFCNSIPPLLTKLIKSLKVGKIQIKEVRKINEYIEIDIPYLEHLAGCYNLALCRALFSYAIGKELDMDETRLNALIFACLWHNSLKLQMTALDSIEFFDLQDQIFENIDYNLTSKIIDELKTSRPVLLETSIVDLCSKFDHMVFDRTFLRIREQEIISAKEFISIMKVEGKFDTSLLNLIEHLMIVSDEDKEISEPSSLYENIILPKDIDILAAAIKHNLSEEQQKQLALHLDK